MPAKKVNAGVMDEMKELCRPDVMAIRAER